VNLVRCGDGQGMRAYMIPSEECTTAYRCIETVYSPDCAVYVHEMIHMPCIVMSQNALQCPNPCCRPSLYPRVHLQMAHVDPRSHRTLPRYDLDAGFDATFSSNGVGIFVYGLVSVISTGSYPPDSFHALR
jgi:hypothetical protein